MATAEHTLSFLLRNSGAVLEEARHGDVVLHRRDGEDLYLATATRERAVRDGLGVAARVLRAVLRDEATRAAVARELARELAWAHFLPLRDREHFLDEFAHVAAACAEAEAYEPLVRLLGDWKATAEAYASPAVRAVLDEAHQGPGVPLPRPSGG